MIASPRSNWLVAFTLFSAFAQSVATGQGDPAAVLAYGHAAYRIPPILIRLVFALLSIPVLWVFIRFILHLLRTFGPAPNVSLTHWAITVEAGFLPYFLLMLLHTAIFGNREVLLRQLLPFYVPFMALFALFVLAAAAWAYRTASAARELPPATAHMSVSKAVVLFVLAAAVIAGELAFLGPR